MIKGLLEFIRGKKEEFVKHEMKTVKVAESYTCGEGTCWYPSEYEEQEVEEIDWEAFEKALEEFELSFKPDGDNSHRNPLNREK